MKVLKRVLLNPDSEQTFRASWDAEILGVQVQNNVPVLYYSNDLNKDQEFPLEIATVMTGSEYNHVRFNRYVGTAMLDDGTFVVHVFTRKAEPK